MYMYKDLTQKQIEILSYLIKFYTSPQNDFLENKYGSYDFSITNQYFKENTEYFLNKKLGIDRIYHSLINAGYSFALQRNIVKSNFEHIKSINEEKNIFMAINEPFVNSLVLNFCIFNELINFKKKQIINSYYLNAKFNYLDKLNNRIQKSGLELIRNGWTAHPFEDKENGIVYKTKIVYESTLNVLSKICHEEDRKIFNESNDRIAWFCDKYLVSIIEKYDIKSVIKDIANNKKYSHTSINVRPNEIPIEMNKFSIAIKENNLMGIEPFFFPSKDDIDMYKENPDLLKNTYHQ